MSQAEITLLERIRLLLAAGTAAINPSTQTATISNGASLSGAIDLAGKTLLGIHMPSAWTTANLTFSVSEDGVTYDDLYDNVGTEKTIIAAASRYIFTTPADLVGIRFVKVRSGTASVPVNQGAARAITLVTKAV